MELISKSVEEVFGSSPVVQQVSAQESSKYTVSQLIKRAAKKSKKGAGDDHGTIRRTKSRRAGNWTEPGRVILLYGPTVQSAGATLNSSLVEKLQLAPCVVGAGGLPSQEGIMASEVIVKLRQAHSEFHHLIRPWKTVERHLSPPPCLITPVSPSPGDKPDDLSRPRLIMSAQLDSGFVPLSSDPLGIKGEMRQDEGHLVVIDGLCTEEERAKILAFLTSTNHDHSGPPPSDKWEMSCVDRAGDQATWGLKQEMLMRLQEEPPDELVAVQSRIQALYPEYLCCHLPADILSEVDEEDESEETIGCSSFVGNAVLQGDPCNWHVDADPSSFPPSSPWVHNIGYYFNREPGKPLLVSVLLYLNDDWPDEFHSETMIMDRRMQCGLFVRPKPGRIFLMDQDLLHRISAPSSLAGVRPRYSLVWKSVFMPKLDPFLVGSKQVLLSRPEWGNPTMKS
jgi:hypothetical protein